MAEDQQERTEEATQQRREDFRRRGQVAQTRELASVLALLGSALLFWAMGRFGLQQMSEAITYTFGPELVSSARTGEYAPIAAFLMKKAAFVVLPIMGMMAVFALVSSIVQVGFLYNEEALEPNLEKINPLSGFQRIFSMRSLAEGIKSLLKLILVSAVVWFLVKDELPRLPYLSQLSVQEIMSYAGELAFRLLAGLGVFMAIIALADYLYQRWDLEQQMKMTKQEVKEEHKSREGDPLIKARIRRIQRDMANKRMMKDVPKADVVVTNPTHIACAIIYDPMTMPAPKLVAKGAGVIAERIKELARENGVPVMENKPLARAIFKTMKIGQIIPRELFAAVAQVLSYVYRLRKKVMR